MNGEDDVDRGTPGGSLLRQYEQRRTRREAQVRGRHPKVGGLLLALNEEPVTTASLRRGAQGEIHVAEHLQRRCGPDVELLFNRRLSSRGKDGDIDVLAVTPSGVHVVDVKRYKPSPVRVRRRDGLLFPLREQLLIGGRDHTRLLASVQRQRRIVRGLVDQVPDGAAIAVHASFCFVDADLPLLTARIDGIALLGTRGCVRRLNKPGPLAPDVRATVLRHLAHHLPPA